MSTFRIEGAKWLERFFPEWNWEELSSDMYENIYQALNGVDDIKNEVVNYIKDRRIRIGFHTQYKSGGGWTLLRNITLSPGDDLMNPYVLSLIVHETFHLKQSLWMRLSLQGELRAWQYQKQCYRRLTSHEIGDYGQAYPGKRAYWDEMVTLNPNSREDLWQAQELMKKVSPDYRSECLPLFPLPQEFAFYWQRGNLKEAFQMVWNLISCR
jgi:hypothetical protein